MFIDILQNLMQEKGINQQQLSIQSKIPLTIINSWFKENRLPDYCSIKKLVVFFNVTSDYLLELDMNYSYRIIELRKNHNLSQAQLASKLNISQSAIAKWETKRTEPTANAIIALSKFFNKSADYILGLKDEWGNKIN